LPLILGVVSSLLWLALRLVLGHYRAHRLLGRPAGAHGSGAT